MATFPLILSSQTMWGSFITLMSFTIAFRYLCSRMNQSGKLAIAIAEFILTAVLLVPACFLSG